MGFEDRDTTSSRSRTNDGTGGTYVYDAESRIISATNGSVTTTYVYDAFGRRISKTSGSTATNYWFGPSGDTLAETDSSGTFTNYIFFGGQRLARNIPQPSPNPADIKYYITDHLHSTAMFVDKSGTVLDDNDFYPWGGVVPGVGTTTSNNHYKFTGKERDDESGLDYFGARYYGNALGRFITPDWAAKVTAVPYAEFGDPQSLNLYSYVRNIPTTKYDADGHCSGDECSKVKVTVTAPPVGVVQNQQAGTTKTGITYQSGVGTTATVTVTDKKGNPMPGLSVKETPTTKDNLTGKSVPTTANPAPVTTSAQGTIKDNVTASLRSDPQPHQVTPEDTAAIKDAAASLPYSRTTDQTLTFSVGGQSCTCTYSETLSNVDSKGNLNTQTNSGGTTFTFTPTTPVVQKKDPQ